LVRSKHRLVINLIVSFVTAIDQGCRLMMDRLKFTIGPAWAQYKVNIQRYVVPAKPCSIQKGGLGSAMTCVMIPVGYCVSVLDAASDRLSS
jgi:hypothetical protein